MTEEGTEGRERSAEQRLADLGRRIDEARKGAREDRERTDRSIERRLDAVRARHGELRAELRQVRTELREVAEHQEQAWNAAFVELDRELDQLDSEVVVLEAQMAADEASAWEEFERAVDEELQAYASLLDALDGRIAKVSEDLRTHSRAAVAHARDTMRAASDALHRAKPSPAQTSASMRRDVHAATEQVDAAVIQAVCDVEAMFTWGDDAMSGAA